MPALVTELRLIAAAVVAHLASGQGVISCLDLRGVIIVENASDEQAKTAGCARHQVVDVRKSDSAGTSPPSRGAILPDQWKALTGCMSCQQGI